MVGGGGKKGSLCSELLGALEGFLEVGGRWDPAGKGG